MLAGCGGGNNPPGGGSNGPPSGLTNRIFVSIQGVSFGGPIGTVAIVNANTDTASSNTISLVGQAPTFLVRTPDKTKTLLLDPRGHQAFTIDNTKESSMATLGMGDSPTSAVILGDNKTAYIAVRNLNQVAIFDITTGTASSLLSISEPRTLVRSNNGNKILVFSDDSNVVNVIDTASNSITAVSDPGSALSRPVFGIFSSDDSKAYILSCGPECGGAAGTANVTVVTMSTLTAGAPTLVDGATIGLLDNSGNLFVAGTTSAGVGKLDVLNANATPVAVTSSVTISDGFHDAIGLGNNNLLFVGARTCNNVITGCLAMYNTSTHAVKIETPKGDVTGIQPIPDRNVVYVTEGGELVIYDTTTSAPQAKQLDIIGTAFDVKLIDK